MLSDLYLVLCTHLVSIIFHFGGQSTTPKCCSSLWSMASILLSSPYASSRHLGSSKRITSIINAYLTKCSVPCIARLISWTGNVHMVPPQLLGVFCCPKAASPTLGMDIATMVQQAHLLYLSFLQFAQAPLGGLVCCWCLCYMDTLFLGVWKGILLLHLMHLF